MFRQQSSSSSPSSLFALCALAFVVASGINSAEAAYTYQRFNELMPEIRRFLGRTHLGTLKIAELPDAYQPRERKSNNLRNLMRIGKRSLAPIAQDGGAAPEVAPLLGATGAMLYYLSPSSLPNEAVQAFRPQAIWLRK